MTKDLSKLSIPELLSEIDSAFACVEILKDPLPGELRYTSNWRGSPLQMLPLAARGLYSEMLTQAWATRARLAQTDEDEIMRLIRATPAEWEGGWPRIRHYWATATDPTTGAEVLVNKKQLEVYLGALMARTVTITRNRAANRASVAARAKKVAPPAAPPPRPAVAPKVAAPAPVRKAPPQPPAPGLTALERARPQ